ncbi:hypothetical protein BJ138DRAFT_625857 [Hygrophoropsis aurantiaca]|uniref:Uncharacterized protein n=1 Tax=Hygrophoropsis aurantiaca TaxID=72124 RepID=A0ACB8AKG1_9AGAM|nr:hypothetical protein BJ138DRAFT_625857 [Hygrophoropsis aurantiaca]
MQGGCIYKERTSRNKIIALFLCSITVMPRAVKNKTQEQTSESRKYFVLQHGPKRVLIARPETYAAALQAVRQHFRNIPEDSVVLQTDQLDVCEGHAVDIDPGLWPEISLLISTAIVTNTTARADALSVAQPPPPVAAPSCSVPAGPILVRRARRVLRKPVLYLYSPAEIDVSVVLSLRSGWKFSLIYPNVPVEQENATVERIRWDVRAHEDGSLVEKSTGTDVAYLFWETITDDTPTLPTSLPNLLEAKQTENPDEYFCPRTCDLCDTDSVVLSTDQASAYLDKALRVLGLHTEARTSFITYWLPDIIKHTHVALRFIPQAAYERAAPLRISPQPAIVTRIFMLFRGVPDEELSKWPGAAKKAEEDVGWWSDVVGVNRALALDTRVFRALEWGGMEVTLS